MTTTSDLRVIVREDLLRTMPFRAETAADDDDGRTLVGHAAVFDTPTLIDTWEGRFTEQIAPGAFKKTFRERIPVLQFEHGRHPVVGSIPIGRIVEAREDDIGAFVKGRLHDNWLVEPVRDAIREESITGMSFRFSVVREDWQDSEGKLIKDDEKLLDMLWDSSEWPLRTLKELKVPELGPVVFPAYEETDVGVRSGRTSVDLATLASSPDERKRFARVLWLADGRMMDTKADAPPKDRHPSDLKDAPLDEHPSDQQDAPPSSGHPSNPTESSRLRTAAIAADMRARLARINERAEKP